MTQLKRVKQRKRRLLVARHIVSGRAGAATLSNCGEFLKPPATAARRKAGCSTRVMTSGMVKTLRMPQWMIAQPSPTFQAVGSALDRPRLLEYGCSSTTRRQWVQGRAACSRRHPVGLKV